MGGALVFGGGRIGRAVAVALRANGPVEVLSRSTHPELANRGPKARQLIREAAARTSATTAVNTVGRLTGSPDVLDDANHCWPAWLATDVLPGLDLRLVHVGSAAEYGDPRSAQPIPERRPPAPISVYGQTKWAGTQAALRADEAGLDVTVVRAFNLVGPDPAPSSPLRQFAADVTSLPHRGGRVTVWDADTIRDFVLLADLVATVDVLTTAPSAPLLVNVCTGIGLRFGDIVTSMGTAQGREVEVESLRSPGIPTVVGDPERVTALLGRCPKMSLERLVTATLASTSSPAR